VRCTCVLTLFVLASISSPADAQAPDAEQLLQIAEKYYEQLEYEESLKVLVQVHQAPNVTPMQKARSFLYMGVCFTALGQAENATLAFVELLKVKPNFRLPPGISPSIQAMFKEALTRLKLPENAPPEQPGQPGQAPEIPVKVTAKAPARVTAGQPVHVEIGVDDPKNFVTGLVLRWRRVGGPDFSSIQVSYKKGRKKVKATIPGATIGNKKGRLQYVVEAVGRGGMTLAHAGSTDEPEVVQLTEPPKGKSRLGWWFLGIGGGLAIAGGIVAAVLLTRSEDTPPGHMADVTVTIH